MKNRNLVLFVPLLAVSSSAALAQSATTTSSIAPQDSRTTAQNASAVASGDIVVTATRQSTLMSKTPIAMTAISGDGLRSAGITDARSLSSAVPNLQITTAGDGLRISIRGVTSTDGTEKGDPSAAFLLDGIYIARPEDQQGAFFDVNRVEVLRGPQGTLYGRNTTAGVVSVITNAPKLGAYEGSLDVKYGNLDSRNATGVINVPLGTSFAMRAAVNYDRQNNYILNGPGATVSLNPFRDVLSGRLSFAGDLGERVHFVVRGDYSRQNGTVNHYLPISNFYPGTLTPTVDPVYVASSAKAQRTLPYGEIYPDQKHNEFYGIEGELSYDLGLAQFTYLGGYRESHRRDVRDVYVFNSMQNPAIFHGDFSQQSHEIRLALGSGKPLHGQVGGYFFREHGDLELNFQNPLAGLVAGNPAAVGFAFPQGPAISRSIAGFGQLTYDITHALHLTGGIRYTQDDKSRIGATVIDLLNSTTGVVTRQTLSSNNASRRFTKATWKAGIDYDVPAFGLLYASVSTGYKAGGFNDGCVVGTPGATGCSLTGNQLYYSPETLTAYEAGFKFRLLDNKVRLNASIFHYDYQGLQLTQTSGNPPASLTKNAGAAKVDGLELEMTVHLSPRDQAHFSFNYLNARYTDFRPDVVNYPNFSFDGRELDHAAKYTGGMGYTHTIPLQNGAKIEGAVETRLSAEYFILDLNNLSQFRQPGFTKTDLTLTYTAKGSRWYVQGFAKNMENSITIATATSGTLGSASIEEPRTFGLRTGLKF
jgi:iron complex outermembrane receptor protein